MPVTLLYFAWVREATGIDSEVRSLPSTLVTLADLARWLAREYPVFADTTRMRAALDQNFASFDDPIAGAREIAFFPPVTGG